MPAYNNYYPATYQPNYYAAPPYPQQFQQPAPQMPQAQPQIQNGGFISVASMDVARNWPVAPGNSVTFKDENAPYVYTKTMGFSQLDRPIFEIYRLVKENGVPEAEHVPTAAPVQAPPSAAHVPEYALKKDVDALKSAVEDLRSNLKPAAKAEKETEAVE